MISTITKVCTKCKIEKSILEFNKDSSRPKGRSWCRQCEKEYAVKYHKSKQGQKKWKQYYGENGEELRNYSTQYRHDNAEKVKDGKRDWYRRNKEKVLTKLRKWRRDNPDEAKKKDKAMRLKHRKMYNRASALHTHRKRAGDWSLTLGVIQRVYDDNIIENDGVLRCVYCTKELELNEGTLEHKQPVSRKGTNKRENLAIACVSCNCSKGNKTEKEFLEYQLLTNLS